MEYRIGKITPALAAFYRASGLEVSEDISADNHPVSTLTALLDGELVGAATLSERGGIMILDYIAVLPAYRRQRIGAELVARLTAGRGPVYLVARAPSFFRSLGFLPFTPPTGHPADTADCRDCPQYGKDCRPVPMYRPERQETT